VKRRTITCYHERARRDGFSLVGGATTHWPGLDYDEQGLSRVVKNLKLLDLPAGSLRVIIMGKPPALPGDAQSLTACSSRSSSRSHEVRRTLAPPPASARSASLLSGNRTTPSVRLRRSFCAKARRSARKQSISSCKPKALPGSFAEPVSNEERLCNEPKSQQR